MSVADFVVGEKVQVHAQGHWYAGVVESVAQKRLCIAYHTNTGLKRRKLVNPELNHGGSVRGAGRFEGPLVRKVTA